MILLRDYNEEKKLDRVWYQSSSVFYSECEDREDDYKVLRVVFNNGSMYEYKNVDVNDYVMFIHGGIDGSNGKALNKFIKAKCEYEKLADANKELLIEEMKKTKEEQEKLLEEQENKNEELEDKKEDTEK